MPADIADHIAHGRQRPCVVVVDRAAEFVLERHNERNSIERISAQILADPLITAESLRIDFQNGDDRVFNALTNPCIIHVPVTFLWLRLWLYFLD